MQITSSAVSLTVADVPASSKFLARHFGYAERMSADGFASLSREDHAPDVILLRRGLEVLPEDMREQEAAGVIVAFVVDDLDAEHERLRGLGAPITLPLREEPWGERLFMVTDPNGVRYELVSWVSS
ncbi:VOC family protein [Actinoplanes sp. RD1]|uniref:VOC family protein n=1 Tax=Actinoplanes sp. RD1 TaxID=3064538 RepID=UPI002741776E|nr:VOC family protein [Actinoplanes sp. RD1]